MAPRTQGNWRSGDYVSAFRLADAWFSMKSAVKLFIYTFRWSIQTCVTMLAITSPSHSHHISNIIFPDYLRSDTGNSFKRLLDARTRSFRPCPFHTRLFHSCPFYPFRQADVNRI